MNKPSKEQELIINTVVKNDTLRSVIVIACAGAGKTTTVILMALSSPNLNFLLLTYNAHLKHEVAKKVLDSNTLNLQVETFHSLACKYYRPGVRTDEILAKVDNKPLKTPEFDVVIVDEAQDMTLVYYKFVKKFLGDHTKKPALVIIGDQYQAVYKFKQADERFLTLANFIYPMKQFSKLTLQTSYRVTRSIAWFVNNVMLGEDRIIACKDGPKIDYIVSSAFTAAYTIIEIISEVLHAGMKPDDIFVLAPSIKRSSSTNIPPTVLENILVENMGVPCYCALNDEKATDDNVIKGKVVFSTFHQSKGRERKVVIVYNFDNGYFKFYNKEAPTNVCPETFYVACTRAKERLIIIEDPKQGRLGFLKGDYNYMIDSGHVKVHFIDSPVFKKEVIKINPKETHKNMVVTDAVRFMKQENLITLTSMLENVFTQECKSLRKIKIPNKVEGKHSGMQEEVADLNALAISSIWEWKHRKRNQLYDILVENLCDEKGQVIKDSLKQINYPCTSNSDYLLLANIYQSFSCGYIHRIAQIEGYDWLTARMVSGCIKNMENNIKIDDETEFEKVLKDDHGFRDVEFMHPVYGKIRFIGRIDVCTSDTVWEIKCVDELQPEHFLQVILYAFIWKLLYINGIETKKKFKIINIRTGEVFSLDTESYLINDIIEVILDSKYGKKKTLSDDEFIEKCLLV